ncbi:Transcription initiation factor TFIID subunit 10 [Phlyctochytrium planicorne]|nr:Transcription initiation factor TFIID subunit 10 [Phlyctochytrium planicorne]
MDNDFEMQEGSSPSFTAQQPSTNQSNNVLEPTRQNGSASKPDGNEQDEGSDGGEEEDEEMEEEEAVDHPHKKRRKTRKEREEERKEKSLGEVLLMMDEYCPIIPDAVTEYYLAKAGFECDDIRVLLALAAQKFIADIASDAYQHCKIRQQAAQGKDKGKTKKTVLTVDDLSGALAEHGINVKKPEYFN